MDRIPRDSHLSLNIQSKSKIIDKRLLHLEPILFFFLHKKHMEGAKSTHSKNVSFHRSLVSHW